MMEAIVIWSLLQSGHFAIGFSDRSFVPSTTVEFFWQAAHWTTIESHLTVAVKEVWSGSRRRRAYGRTAYSRTKRPSWLL